MGAHRIAILTDQRWRQVWFTIHGNRKLHRSGLLEVGALYRMLTTAEEVDRRQVRVVHYLAQIAHRLRRNLRRVAAGKDFSGSERRREAGNRLIEFGLRSDPQLRRRKVLLIQEVRLVEQGEYPRPCVVGIRQRC